MTVINWIADNWAGIVGAIVSLLVCLLWLLAIIGSAPELEEEDEIDMP